MRRRYRGIIRGVLHEARPSRINSLTTWRCLPIPISSTHPGMRPLDWSGRAAMRTLPAMVFTTLMLPDEMRHPTLALAGPGRRGLRANLSAARYNRNICNWVVLGVPAVEIYRAIPQA
jgi:hypothetical protein